MARESDDKLLDALPFAVVLIGADERVRHANPAARALLGEGLAGHHYITVLRHPVLLDCIEAALTRGEAARGEYPASGTAPQETYRVHAAPVAGEGGRAVVLSFEDVTHLHEADQIRRDFVANVSHELRTPLTALMGYVETLRGAARDDARAQERFLERMQDEAGRMDRLVGDLLSLSRVESDERVRPTAPVDLSAILRAAACSLEPVAESLQVKLLLEGVERPHRVPGDGDQLMQVFSNLIENAIKYGARPGTVTVRLAPPAHEPALRGPAVRIDVRDEGEGIDPIHIPRLTERFYRVDSHRSREMGGTGLGLAIVKHIVNRHRGRLRISSTPGRGSCFSVLLPAG